jgi:hypothetical protein
MRVPILFVFILFANTIVTAQVLEGTILDRSNQKPVEGVHITGNDKSTGSISDQKGQFKIEISNHYYGKL